ncbi:helix-turn-helix transcriptional regulator [Amycolatopsis sp. H6(2020)]|nr:helix-turn-helix transcriptional regulator [Amycolatopsis sp. H6(2020)]
MLRIHFSDADLGRVRVLSEPNPLWEILLSLHRLVPGKRDGVVEGWRHALPADLRRTVAFLHQLARPKGYSPDFLTPAAEVPDFGTALGLVLGSPRRRLGRDIAELAVEAPVPTWVRDLASGDPAALRLLGGALTTYHEKAIVPFWPAIRRLARADQECRAAVAVERGLEAMLVGLHAGARWRPPVLEIPYPVEQNVFLGGAGLILVPSLFCGPRPITLLRQAEQPLLVYPVDAGQARLQHAADGGRSHALTSLLGRTRAQVLHALADVPALNTTELARAAGISLAGASQHASVLRDAGLVLTERRGGSVQHRISPQGARLL